jgi:pimeloyl-ACP methyl ester carboxylesterase
VIRKVRDVDLHYEVEGQGRPLVMLHGIWADHHHMMYDFEPQFADRPGWQRIYVDLPGMGATPTGSWMHNQDDMLDVLVSFLAEVVPAGKLVVAGVSYGGYLARGLVHHLESRVEAVCLIVPLVYGFDHHFDVPPNLTLVYDSNFRRELAPEEIEMYDELVIQDRGVVEVIRDQLTPAVLRADGDFIDNRLCNGANASFSFDPDSIRAKVEGPSLFVLGRQDSTVGYRDAWTILENYPRATFAVLDRAGHFASWDQQALVKVLVSEWLDRLEEYTTSAID